MAKHHVIHYESFLPRLISGLRQAWEDVRRQRPRETFYLFGIATDCDVVVLTPFWNTEEKYAEGESEYAIDKWVVPREGYESGKYTAELQSEVNRYELEDHSDEPDSLFEERKARLLQIFEQALVQLDAEGFFGEGERRHQVLLKIDRGDCNQAEWEYTLQVIQRINPPESTVQFLRALKEQTQKDADRKQERDSLENPIKAIAIEFLRREQRPFDRVSHATRFEAVTPFMLQFLPEQRMPEELWSVCVEARHEPRGQAHGAGVLIVWVNPRTGECVIPP